MSGPDLATSESRAAAAVTLANGGGTFDADTLAEYAGEGYAVGGIVKGRTVPLRSAIPADSIAIAILSQRAIMRSHGIVGGYVGTWIDGATVYVDAVVILPDLASAGILARTLGERAVYAFREGETILAEDARATRA